MKLNARQLREVEEKEVKEKVKNIKRNPIYLILENIYDTYNVGGLFRLADAIGVEKIYLCGETEVPPNSRIKKASIGTYKVVAWEYKRQTKDAILALRKEWKKKKKSLNVIAIEQSKEAIEYIKGDYSLPIAVIVGNETYGIIPKTLKLVDSIVEIPMWGINKSLNVIVSAAIVCYFAVKKC